MNKNLEKLIELSKENPELPIVTMVEAEIVAGDDFGYWLGSFGFCEVGEVYYSEERVYLDRDDWSEDYADQIYDLPEYVNMPDKEFEEMLDKKADELFEPAIIVYIQLPEA